MTDKPKLTEVKKELQVEILFENRDQVFSKIKIPGGFLYHARFLFGQSGSESMCFVPEDNNAMKTILEKLNSILESLLTEIREMRDEKQI